MFVNSDGERFTSGIRHVPLSITCSGCGQPNTRITTGWALTPLTSDLDNDVRHQFGGDVITCRNCDAPSAPERPSGSVDEDWNSVADLDTFLDKECPACHFLNRDCLCDFPF